MIENAQTIKETMDVKDLLLEDYRYYGDWLQRNEEAGDKRINLYVTLLTAIPAGIVAISEKNDLHIMENQSMQIIMITALAALLPFGIFIFFRLIKRNAVTDEMKFTLDNIRQQYMDIFDGSCFLSYEMLPKKKNPLVQKTKEKKDARRWVSLVYLVLFLNTLVFTSFLYILLNLMSINNTDLLVFVCIAFPVSILLQYWKITERNNENNAEINNFRFTHAGGIVFKKSVAKESPAGTNTSKNNIEYLLNTKNLTNDQKEDVMFPMGQIATKEEISQSALQIVFKKTGVIAKNIRPIGTFAQGEEKLRIKVKIYLMEFLEEVQPNEKSELKWLPFEKAYNELSFSESQRIMFQAHAFLLSNSVLQDN